MAPPSQKTTAGYSLIELLVVLSIVGILAMVGVYMIGNRKGMAVQGVMDEVEGVIAAAQRNTVVSSTDVWLQANGGWIAGTLTMDGRSFVGAPGIAAARVGSNSEIFNSHYPAGDHAYAGVDSTGVWYTAALGSGAPLAATAPISGQADFVTALGNPLFTGANNYIVINGLTKRFETGFYIAVVGLSSGGVPLTNGPIGLLVMPVNSSSVYKFYRSDNNSPWRRR